MLSNKLKTLMLGTIAAMFLTTTLQAQNGNNSELGTGNLEPINSPAIEATSSDFNGEYSTYNGLSAGQVVLSPVEDIFDVVFNFDLTNGSKEDGGYESIFKTAPSRLLGEEYNVAALVQTQFSAFFLTTPGNVLQTFNNGTNKPQGTNEAYPPGQANMVVSEMLTQVGFNQFLVQVQITSVDSLGNPIPWVPSGFTVGGNVLTAWRMDLGTSTAVPNRLLPAADLVSIDAATITAFNSAGIEIASFPMSSNASNITDGLAGLGVLSIGGEDIAGFDLASFQLAWTYTTVPELNIQISDPCACDDPLNIQPWGGLVELFHDVLVVDIGIAGQTVTISQSSTPNNFVDINGIPIPVATQLIDQGDGTYTLSFYRPPGTSFSVEVDVNGVFQEMFNSDPCLAAADCPAAPIPTMSEWGLIILALLMLQGIWFTLVFKPANLLKELPALWFQGLRAALQDKSMLLVMGIIAVSVLSLLAFFNNAQAADIVGIPAAMFIALPAVYWYRKLAGVSLKVAG